MSGAVDVDVVAFPFPADCSEDEEPPTVAMPLVLPPWSEESAGSGDGCMVMDWRLVERRKEGGGREIEKKNKALAI